MFFLNRSSDTTASDPVTENEIPVTVQDQTSVEEAIGTEDVESPTDEIVTEDSPTEVSENDSPDEGIEDSPQVIGSLLMYQAHVSLRQPAINDPDSPENKALLETMVFKALAKQKIDSPEPSLVH